MNKKFYMAPESEEVMLEIESSLLAGSEGGVTDINDGDPADMSGSDDNEGDGF